MSLLWHSAWFLIPYLHYEWMHTTSGTSKKFSGGHGRKNWGSGGLPSQKLISFGPFVHCLWAILLYFLFFSFLSLSFLLFFFLVGVVPLIETFRWDTSPKVLLPVHTTDGHKSVIISSNVCIMLSYHSLLHRSYHSSHYCNHTL